MSGTFYKNYSETESMEMFHGGNFTTCASPVHPSTPDFVSFLILDWLGVIFNLYVVSYPYSLTESSFRGYPTDGAKVRFTKEVWGEE